MNVALLAKWIWKLAQNTSDLWANLLRAKYFPNGNFFEVAMRRSAFWNGIHVVKFAFALCAKFEVQEGKLARF